MSGCSCWECRPTATIYDLAPRLARARDQLVAERREARISRRRARAKLLRAERLLAHRELQLLRAGAYKRPNIRYMAERQRKLSSARRIVERLREEAA